MAGFVQIIEFRTDRIDEVTEAVQQRRDQAPGTVRRGTYTADRERPGYYLSILEFDSYESAMENSERPETAELAAKMRELCDGPPKFYNLDVSQTWEP